MLYYQIGIIGWRSAQADSPSVHKRYYLKGDYSNEKDIQNAFCISHRNDLPRNRWNHDMVRAHICGS